MSDIIEKYNQIAHENCLRKLNQANARIVEFEDIKKAHLEYVKGLKEQIQELEERMARLKYSCEITCFDCFESISWTLKRCKEHRVNPRD